MTGGLPEPRRFDGPTSHSVMLKQALNTNKFDRRTTEPGGRIRAHHQLQCRAFRLSISVILATVGTAPIEPSFRRTPESRIFKRPDPGFHRGDGRTTLQGRGRCTRITAKSFGETYSQRLHSLSTRSPSERISADATSPVWSQVAEPSTIAPSCSDRNEPGPAPDLR